MKCNEECEWEGTVDTLEAHKATCDFTLVPCPNQCDIVYTCEDNFDDDPDNPDSFDIEPFVMRKDLAHHLENNCTSREHQCEHCGEKGRHIVITGVHEEVCDEKIVTCPNPGCKDSMKNQSLKRHITRECDFTEVPCKYRKLGCDVRMRRSCISKHEERKDKLHLHMALNMVSEVRDMKDSSTFPLKGLKASLFSTPNVPTDTPNLVYFSAPFYSGPNGYLIQVRVIVCANQNYRKGMSMTVAFSFPPGEHDDQLSWPFEGKITCRLLNQLQNSNHYTVEYNIVKEDCANRDSGLGGDHDFISYHELVQSEDPDMDIKYLQDETMYFNVSVDSPEHSKPWLECSVSSTCYD